MAEARAMSKADIVGHFGERLGMTRSQARAVLDELQQLSVSELRRAGEFSLPGIAKLVVQHVGPRTARNPLTGEQVQVPAKDVVKARISKGLRDSVQGT